MFTIILTPKQTEFIENMIAGTSQAKATLLDIATGQGEFEVNKMDDKSVNYFKTRFLKNAKDVYSYIKRISYNPEKVLFAPISGWMENKIIEASPNMPCYKGL